MTWLTVADGATLARVTYVAHPDRKGGGGLSLRTLAIASAASMTAALVTSRLFPPGTAYTAALTPVIVAAVSELLHRPADRVSELRRQRQTMVLEARELETAQVLGEETSPLAGAPDFVQGDAADELIGNGSGAHQPMRTYGRSRSRALHPKVWIVTGLAAFAIAAAVLTLPELIFGGSVSTKRDTTLFGGGSSSAKTETETKTTTTPSETTTTPQQTVTETVPAQTPPAQTETQTTTTDTGTSTTPSGGTPPPSDTGTSTAPAPSGVVPPTP